MWGKKISRSAVWPQQQRRPLKITLFLYSDVQFELHQIVLTTSTCLNVLSCFHVIDNADI